MLLWLEGEEENGVKTRSSFPAPGPPAYNAPEPDYAKACLGNVYDPSARP